MALLLQPGIIHILYRRLIDDMYIIQRNTPNGYIGILQVMHFLGQDGAKVKWESPGSGHKVFFCLGQDGAKVKWESPGSGHKINSRDLNIQLNRDRSLMTCTSQKLMNLYLF